MGTIDRLRTYVERNRRAVARDLLVAIVWVTALRWVFETQGYPEWLYYVVLFGGLVVYVSVVPAAGTAPEERD